LHHHLNLWLPSCQLESLITRPEHFYLEGFCCWSRLQQTRISEEMGCAEERKRGKEKRRANGGEARVK
jgi:hypothetical protein